MNPRYRTPETRAAAVAAYAAGETSEAVAKEFGASASSVVAWCRDAGVPIRRNGGRKAADAYEGGWEIRGGVSYPLQPEKRSA